jgi:hypothetical protein
MLNDEELVRWSSRDRSPASPHAPSSSPLELEVPPGPQIIGLMTSAGRRFSKQFKDKISSFFLGGETL